MSEACEHCSGDMYCGVPMMRLGAVRPGSVSWTLGSVC